MVYIKRGIGRKEQCCHLGDMGRGHGCVAFKSITATGNRRADACAGRGDIGFQVIGRRVYGRAAAGKRSQIVAAIGGRHSEAFRVYGRNGDGARVRALVARGEDRQDPGSPLVMDHRTIPWIRFSYPASPGIVDNIRGHGGTTTRSPIFRLPREPPYIMKALIAISP